MDEWRKQQLLRSLYEQRGDLTYDIAQARRKLAEMLAQMDEIDRAIDELEGD